MSQPGWMCTVSRRYWTRVALANSTFHTFASTSKTTAIWVTRSSTSWTRQTLSTTYNLVDQVRRARQLWWKQVYQPVSMLELCKVFRDGCPAFGALVVCGWIGKSAKGKKLFIVSFKPAGALGRVPPQTSKSRSTVKWSTHSKH